MLQHIGSLGVTHRCRGLCARVGSARPGIIVLASLLALACVLIDRASVNCSARIAVSCVGHDPDFMLKSPWGASKSFTRVVFQLGGEGDSRVDGVSACTLD